MLVAYHTEIDTQWNSQELERKLLLLPVQMQQRVLAYKDWREQQLRICGKLLLRELIATFNAPVSLHDMQYNQWSKPYFNAPFDFNIAHTGNMAVCVGTDEGAIGIDIEHRSPQNELPGSVDVNEMKEYFTENEWNLLNSSPNKNAVFYNLWVRKEALLKAAGKGADVPFSSIDVTNDTVVYSNKQYYLHNIELQDGYHICIASDKKINEIKFTQININNNP